MTVGPVVTAARRTPAACRWAFAAAA
jgi:hypothetical protein